MNCQDFELIVIHLARNQLIDAARREQSLAHAEVCHRCAERLAGEQMLTAGARAVIAEISGEEAPAHVESALLLTFRAQAGQRDTPAIKLFPARKRSLRWKIGTAWAAAALAIILLGAMWFRSNPKLSPGQPAISRQPKEAPALNGEVDVAGQKPQINAASAWQPKKRVGIRRAPTTEDEDANRFYPLVEEDELVPLESGQIVRVEVPLSALVALGMPVTVESINQSVQADLLLGQDGLARAIRFLP